MASTAAVSTAPPNEIEIGDRRRAPGSPLPADHPLKSRGKGTKYIYTKSKTPAEWDSCIHYEYNVVAVLSVRLHGYVRVCGVPFSTESINSSSQRRWPVSDWDVIFILLKPPFVFSCDISILAGNNWSCGKWCLIKNKDYDDLLIKKHIDKSYLSIGSY